MPSLLTPDDLDAEAARLVESAAWRDIVAGWATAPAPRDTELPLVQAVPGLLLTKTTDELVAEALASIPADVPVERRLPGRLGAILPDRLHAWRRIGQPDCKPSVQLAVAAQVLREWGWQRRPYRLRDARGARCVCGAILAAERLGYGSRATTEISAGLVLAHLRRYEAWAGLIGPWNRQPGRTAEQAVALLTAVSSRSSQAGH